MERELVCKSQIALETPQPLHHLMGKANWHHRNGAPQEMGHHTHLGEMGHHTHLREMGVGGGGAAVEA